MNEAVYTELRMTCTYVGNIARMNHDFVGENKSVLMLVLGRTQDFDL